MGPKIAYGSGLRDSQARAPEADNGAMSLFGRKDPLADARAFRAAGTVSAERMAHELRSAELFVLFDGEAPSLHPLAVSTPDGYDVLCAFTSAERATQVQHTRPDCKAAITVEASWLLATVPHGCGLVIDAGTPQCRWLEPDSVGWLREEMRRAA